MLSLIRELELIQPTSIFGRVTAIKGMLVEIAGPLHTMSIGTRIKIKNSRGEDITCEVVGFHNKRALLLPFASLEGIHMGAKAWIESSEPAIYPSDKWLGRVINALAQPLDNKGKLSTGPSACLLRNSPPQAHSRNRVGNAVDLGIKALNSYVTCCEGQRIGIFAGSGVGKSVLFSMLARNAKFDVAVIGMVGERGREVQEFISEELDEETLKRTILVVSTSDESPLMRRQAAYLTMAISEYFRDKGKRVLCMIDSITRIATAQREIGLSAGEPPTSKGYPPTVFSELPKLLERAGPGIGQGSITGLFTVLVEGDDHNEPISDTVRSILDGHIVMDREIAERGRYPAVNILKSISRTMPNCIPLEYQQLISDSRNLISQFSNMEEVIRLGAYTPGSDEIIDRAIEFHEPLEEFLSQKKEDYISIEDSYNELAQIMQGYYKNETNS